MSEPAYNTVRVVTSTVRSDHKAVVAYAGECRAASKTKTVKTFRPVTPARHASFLRYAEQSDIFEFDTNAACTDIQIATDTFYVIALQLLDHFYPQRTITVSSRDPSYVTPVIKAKLRRKNRLMRAGRVEEASAIAQSIGRAIAQRSKLQLSRINHKTSSKDMWTAVKQITGRQQDIPTADGFTAEALNRHYAGISSDQNYWPPQKRHTVALSHYEPVYEWQVFSVLDKLPATATGLDQLPAWFLCTGALFFYRPITRLFNASIATSTIPHQ